MTADPVTHVCEPPPTTYPVAELDRRFYAFAIDRVLAWSLVLLVALGSWLALDRRLGWVLVGILGASMLLTWLGLAVLAGLRGTSPGKSLLGLRVVHHDTGTPVGVGRALVRAAVLGLSSVPTFGIGLATLAWTAVADPGRQRRGWHDHLARSVVVDVRPVPEQVDQVQEAPRHIVNLTAMRLVPTPPVEMPTTPPRVSAPEQSPRRPPLPQPTSAPRSGADPAADPGRTVVRPSRGGPPAVRWRVTLDTGESLVVEGLALLGRRPEPRPGEPVRHLVPLPSTDMSVSKTHAQLGLAEDGVLVVTDRGSTNGSVLVRRGVARQLTAGRPTTLLDGDRISLGDRELTVTREG